MVQGPQQLVSDAYDLVAKLSDGTFVGLMLAADENGLPMYADRTADPFVPSQREGATGYDDFPPDIDTPMAQDDWSFGLGHLELESDNPESLFQLASLTNIAVEHRNAFLAPRIEPEQTGSAFTPDYFLVTSTDKLLAFAGAGVYLWNTSTVAWDLKDTMAGSVSGPPVEFNTRVFVPLGSSTPIETSANDFATAGVASTLTDANATGFAVYHNDDNVPLLIKWDDTNEIKSNTSGVNGGTQWASATLIGDTSSAIQWVKPMGGAAPRDQLVVFKTDGRYLFDAEGNVKDENPDYRAAPYASYGVGGQVWQDRSIIYPTRNSLIRWDPFADTEQERVYPPKFMLGTRKNLGQPLFVAADEGAVYMLIKNKDAEYRLLRGRPSSFRPQGARDEHWAWDWGLNLGSNVSDALAYVPSTANGTSNAWLIFRYGSTVRTLILPQSGMIAIQDSACRYTDEGVMYTPFADANLAERSKAFRFLRASGIGVTASSKMSFAYNIDGDGQLEDLTYTALGLWEDSSSSFEQSVPATTTGRRISTEMRLYRGGALPEDTPILHAVVWHSVIRGPKLKRRSATVFVDDGIVMKNGSQDSQTGDFLRSQLSAAERQVPPVRWYLLDSTIVDAHINYSAQKFVTVRQGSTHPTMKSVVEIGFTDTTESVAQAAIYDTGKRYDDSHIYAREF